MKKKIFTLLTLLVCVCSGAWATDYSVSATRELSNEKKTCTWSEIVANSGTAINAGSNTATGAGLYFDCTGGKIQLASGTGQKRNVKAGAIMYVEVPSATAAGSITINNGNATDRYFETKSEAKLYMKETDGNGANTVDFTSADIETVSGTPYLKLTSKSDNKFEGFTVTLTSSDVFPEIVVATQEITGVSLNGTDISASDLATLKSDNAITIDGSSLNGLGSIVVSLSSGSTSVSRSISGTSAIFTFTINTDDEYTITVTNVVKTYTLEGLPVYYKKGDTEATGVNTTSLTANGITFTYPTKTFQYGAATVTISGDEYQPIKLSTGEGVTVTFPTGTKATKIIVYGWSAEGNGYMKTFKNASEGDKSIDTNANIFYATNDATSNYPSVYEYDVDNWEGLYFECAGSQPFIVVDFVLSTTITTPAYAKSTYVTTNNLDFSAVSPAGLKAYVATAAAGGKVTLEEVGAVPAGTPLMLIGTASTEYTVPVAASASAPAVNMFVAGDGTTEFSGLTYDFILYNDGKFYQIGSGTVATTKAYLHCVSDPRAASAPGLSIEFGNGSTGINVVNGSELKVNGEYYNLAGQRVANPTKGLYIVNGKKVIVK